MTYKQITKERHKIEPYFIEAAKECYKTLNFSDKQYSGQIETILYDNNVSVSLYYIENVLKKLIDNLYPQLSYDVTFETFGRNVILYWNTVEIYDFPLEDISGQKHGIKLLLQIILYVRCCVQQRKAIKNIVKFNPFDK